MEDFNEKVIQRLDRIIEIQTRILNCLNTQERKLEIKSTKRKTQLDLPSVEDVDYWLLNRHYLKSKFKLVSTPQFDTCIAYKNTGDDSIFDRFKKIK